MSKFPVAAGILAFALTAFGAPGAAPAAMSPRSAVVPVPAKTTVTLVPTGTGGMAGAHNVGDPIDFTVKEPVIIDGWVVIPKGAPAHGVISALTSAGSKGFMNEGYSQASLHFSFEWVQLSTGKLRLDDAPVEVKGRQIKRKVGLFNTKEQFGIDPFLTAVEYGVDATTASSVHVATSLRATALEEAGQTNQYIDK